MANGKEILICDDQPMIHETLGVYLENEGFTYCSAYDGEQALQMFDSKKPDLVILDLMMPKKSGTEVCREIRAKSRTPIIMLTAKGEEIERIVGLELGADDYIVKPFQISELTARVDALLRRMGKSVTQFSLFGVEINTESRIVTKDGIPIDLTLKEFDLLVELIRNKNVALYRDRLYEKVWNEPFTGETRTLDSHIQRLRKKLDWDEHIKTVFRIGYRLEV